MSALDAALGQHIPSSLGLVFHSDRGSQYASGDYRAALLWSTLDHPMPA